VADYWTGSPFSAKGVPVEVVPKRGGFGKWRSWPNLLDGDIPEDEPSALESYKIFFESKTIDKNNDVTTIIHKPGSYMYDCRVVRKSSFQHRTRLRRLADEDVLDVGSSKDDVLIDFAHRSNRTISGTVLRSKRTNWKQKKLNLRRRKCEWIWETSVKQRINSWQNLLNA